MGAVVTTRDVSLIDLYLDSETRKEIEEFGWKEIHRRRVVLARVYRRNDSPLAAGVQEEADTIEAIFGLGSA